MAVHNLGYRPWSGRRAPHWTRWAVITLTGVRRAWQSRWLRRMLFLAWLPAVWFGVGFFLWEQSLLYPEWRRELTPFIRSMPPNAAVEVLLEGFEQEDPGKARHAVWAWLLQSFFRYPQGVIMVLVVGLIAPALISQDVRSRAFLLYFSRPLTRGEYVLGKAGTIWVYLLIISTLPALCLYGLGVLLSPHLNVVESTWDLPLRILAASAVLMIPTAALALCFSSLTQESRYAGFAWFALWILGWFTYGVLTTAEAFGQPEALTAATSGWSYLSLYHTLGRVQSWVFGFSEFREAAGSMVLLAVLTVVSLLVLLRRIAAPMRV